MDHDPAVALLTMGFLFGVGMGFFIANVLLWGKYHHTKTEQEREAEHTTED
jgi:hypothetical protein